MVGARSWHLNDSTPRRPDTGSESFPRRACSDWDDLGRGFKGVMLEAHVAERGEEVPDENGSRSPPRMLRGGWSSGVHLPLVEDAESGEEVPDENGSRSPPRMLRGGWSSGVHLPLVENKGSPLTTLPARLNKNNPFVGNFNHSKTETVHRSRMPHLLTRCRSVSISIDEMVTFPMWPGTRRARPINELPCIIGT